MAGRIFLIIQLEPIWPNKRKQEDKSTPKPSALKASKDISLSSDLSDM
jgi:hypothetical protein